MKKKYDNGKKAIILEKNINLKKKMKKKCRFLPTLGAHFFLLFSIYLTF